MGQGDPYRRISSCYVWRDLGWIQYKVAEGRWKALRASITRPKLSNLFFADDLLLFFEASDDQVGCVTEGLERFCRALGQKVNFQISLLYCSPKVPSQDAERLSLELGIPQTKDLGRYLGQQLVHSGNNRVAYEQMLQRIQNKLEGWKTKCLSRAGRLTLAHSMLSSIPTFYSSWRDCHHGCTSR